MYFEAFQNFSGLVSPLLLCPGTFFMDDPNLNLDLFGQSVADDSEDDVHQDHQEEEGNESGPGVHGKYIGREMIKMRSDGKKKEVEYNSWGQAISDGADKLHSEIGKYRRHHVTLLVDDWRLISKEVKDKLWNEMLSMFITGTKTKSYVLSVGGDRWREFKSYLTNFIYTHKDDNPQLLDKPPKLYENVIDPEEWKAFVDYRLSEEWLVKRKSAQSSRKQNKCNHRTGRGGVRKVREKMEKELGHQIDDVDRADLWINMYKNKKGEFDVETQKVVDKTDLEWSTLRAIEHWMVILIQMGSQSVAFLDSRNKTIRQDIKRCVQTALERYYLEKRNRRSVAISFTEYRCPEQPDGDQCGYYSMRFIKSFMTENNPTRKLETEFKRNISSSCTNKEINETGDEWAKRYSTKDYKIALNKTIYIDAKENVWYHFQATLPIRTQKGAAKKGSSAWAPIGFDFGNLQAGYCQELRRKLLPLGVEKKGEVVGRLSSARVSS
ncbi:hypothetical protein G4B88_029834 [Cannabis sativa]|uniref:Ubiquitin-like protease family profile domain-containing protein n=1 Tax=Cannabis sativa TaxID=3483 RepID=A0A7J6GHB2_CANSA|nr:hypothetical protein G4B88_029834 [Cannabis sativa]